MTPGTRGAPALVQERSSRQRPRATAKARNARLSLTIASTLGDAADRAIGMATRRSRRCGPPGAVTGRSGLPARCAWAPAPAWLTLSGRGSVARVVSGGVEIVTAPLHERRRGRTASACRNLAAKPASRCGGCDDCCWAKGEAVVARSLARRGHERRPSAGRRLMLKSSSRPALRAPTSSCDRFHARLSRKGGEQAPGPQRFARG
jgi:hypothetical protein